MHNVLHEKYYNIGKSERYLVQTWSHTKSSRVKLLEVHGLGKSLDPNVQLEKQTIKPPKLDKNLQIRPRIGQGGAGLGRKKPNNNEPIAQSVEHSQKIPEALKIEKEVINMPNFTTPVQSISNPRTEVINRRMKQKISKDIPFYSDPTYTPLLNQ